MRPHFLLPIDRATKKLQLQHSDVYGSITNSRRYFATLINDYSRFCAIYLINHKNDALKKIKGIYFNRQKQIPKNV